MRTAWATYYIPGLPGDIARYCLKRKHSGEMREEGQKELERRRKEENYSWSWVYPCNSSTLEDGTGRHRSEATLICRNVS